MDEGSVYICLPIDLKCRAALMRSLLERKSDVVVEGIDAGVSWGWWQALPLTGCGTSASHSTSFEPQLLSLQNGDVSNTLCADLLAGPKMGCLCLA